MGGRGSPSRITPTTKAPKSDTVVKKMTGTDDEIKRAEALRNTVVNVFNHFISMMHARGATAEQIATAQFRRDAVANFSGSANEMLNAFRRIDAKADTNTQMRQLAASYNAMPDSYKFRHLFGT